MMPEEQKAVAKREFIRALVIDGVFVGMGVVGFFATKNWTFLIAGFLLGSMFLIPAFLTYSKLSERK